METVGVRSPRRAALWSQTALRSLQRVREKKKSKVKLGKKENLAHIIKLRVNFGGDIGVQSLHSLKSLSGQTTMVPGVWPVSCGCATVPRGPSLAALVPAKPAPLSFRPRLASGRTCIFLVMLQASLTVGLTTASCGQHSGEMGPPSSFPPRVQGQGQVPGAEKTLEISPCHSPVTSLLPGCWPVLLMWGH